MKATLTPHGDAVREILDAAQGCGLGDDQLLVVRSLLMLWAGRRDAGATPDEGERVVGDALASALNVLLPLYAEARGCACQSCRTRQVMTTMSRITSAVLKAQLAPDVVQRHGGVSLDLPSISMEVAGHG